MPAFDAFDYSLRTNKNIERKLIFKGLQLLATKFDFTTYRYIGLASLWFIDFIIAHKLLAISDLVSIEQDHRGATRALFNKPYACVEVLEGQSSIVLDNLDLTEKPLVAWLDYEVGLETFVCEDISQLCSHAPTGSIILVTINAHPGQLDAASPSDQQILSTVHAVIDNKKSNDSEKLAKIRELVTGANLPIQAKRLTGLNQLAGSLVPTGTSADDLQGSKIPALFAKILFNQFEHSVNMSGREEIFVPLFNYSYKDGAPMITVGGMLVNGRDQSSLDELDIYGQRPYLTGTEQLEIGVPPLTLKEKLALDQLLPCAEELTVEEVREKYSFLLRERHISAYQQFYKHYPVYRELDI